MDFKTFFSRALAVVAGAALFTGAFLVSMVFFVVALAVGVVLGGWFLWRTRHLRRQMRERAAQWSASRPDQREVIEGTVISSETVDDPPRERSRPGLE